MNAINTHSAAAPQSASVELRDVYYVLFRQKWKILLGLVLGIVGAVVFYQLEVPLYQSEAKLLVRYIITETKMTGPNATNASSKIVSDQGASIMLTEREILTSMDLAREVVDAIGPQRILGKNSSRADTGRAIEALRSGLRVNIATGSSVIQISFRHPDSEVVTPVMRELVERYLKLHVATHRSSGMLSDTLAQESDTLRAKLAATEEQLRQVTNRAGVVSLEAAKEAYNAQLISIRREILGYEAELAGRLAVLGELRKLAPGDATPATSSTEEKSTPASEVPLSADILEQYRALSQKLSRLQAHEQDLAFQFTPENPRMKLARTQIAEAEVAMRLFRERHPQLSASAASNVSGRTSDPANNDAATAWIQITSYQAKIKELRAQYERLGSEVAKLDQMEGQILELRRKKEIEESNYRYYAANYEQTRINETLGGGKVSNISQIQAPSPAFREQLKIKKPAVAMFGGLALGLAWAFLIEFYLDRSIRRPNDVPKLLASSLFLSIPRLTGAARKNLQLPEKAGAGGSAGAMAPYFASDSLRPFHETLRDRLIGFFESRNMTHKPKLIAVTGLMNNAGVTTTAAGLARSLSETGDGNVLLVDMTASQGSAQQFVRGKPTCDLDELLEARSQAHVNENLYVVAESENSDRLSRNLPKRFAQIIPKLKASDFDYIIFDMPKVNQVSITPRLASFMDIVLLVVESEKTDRQLVQGASELLGESKVHVGVVLNKTRTYVPTRFQQELMTE